MKPRSKRQFLVTKLSSELPDIAEKLQPWAFKNCIQHIAYRNKMWTNCLSCGHVWPTTSMTIKTEVCQGCGWKVHIETSRKLKHRDWARFAILTMKEEFQVIRFFHINCHMKTATKPYMYTHEIMQHWILPNGDYEIISRNVGGLGLSYDHFHGSMSLKDRRDLYKYNTPVYKIHPASKVQPVLLRNGFTCKMKDIKIFSLLKYLAIDSKVETLLKTNQAELLNAYLGDRHAQISYHWPSVKICIRNGYKVKDPICWLDYLHLLRYFKKDLYNAKYICPANLKREHDQLSAKKQAILKEERTWNDYVRLVEYFEDTVNPYLRKKPVSLKLEIDRLTAHRIERERRLSAEKRAHKIQEDQKAYAKLRGHFFDVVFTDGNITVAVLQSIDEFVKEGEALKHCVFSNEYYKKEKSLILSARIDSKPIETIEIALDTMEIVQARGVGNTATQHHDDILKLVKKNLKVIRKKYKGVAA